MESTIKAGFWKPELNLIGDKSGTEGELLEFTVNAADPNGNSLTYSASNLPTGAVFNSSAKTFKWTPSIGDKGIYSNVRFEVSDGQYIDSENITITIGEMPPPEITGVGATNITSSSADITWNTNQAATSKVEYGTTVLYGLSEESSSLVNAHNIPISGLTAGTLHHYRVISKNNANKETTSADYTFTTDASPQ